MLEPCGREEGPEEKSLVWEDKEDGLGWTGKVNSSLSVVCRVVPISLEHLGDKVGVSKMSTLLSRVSLSL